MNEHHFFSTLTQLVEKVMLKYTWSWK